MNETRKKNTGEPGNGGEFGTKSLPESNGGLPVTADPSPEDERFIAAFCDYHGWTEEDFEAFGGYGGNDYDSEFNWTAQVVSHEFTMANNGLAYAYTDIDSTGEGYTAGLRFKDASFAVVNHYDIKNSTSDRSATGRDAALAIRDTIAGDLASLKANAERDTQVLPADTRHEPMEMSEALERADENGMLTTNHEVDLAEFLASGESDEEIQGGESRFDYLATRQVQGGVNAQVGYTLLAVRGDKAYVQVTNDIAAAAELTADDQE